MKQITGAHDVGRITTKTRKETATSCLFQGQSTSWAVLFWSRRTAIFWWYGGGGAPGGVLNLAPTVTVTLFGLHGHSMGVIDELQ